jgi:cation:H+ antiporter
VVGSNIFNVLFILGISAVVTPLVVAAQMVRQEVPIMIGASLLLFVLALDGAISRGEGALLFALLIGYTVFLVWQSRRETKAIQAEYASEQHVAARIAWDDRLVVQLLLIAAGLVLLVVGARWLVLAATTVARSFGVSELVIGLTIVAAGTSLPEVAASVTAALKGQRDIAVGNVVGSNTFNILGVLGLSALVAPSALAVAPSLLQFDMLVMLAVAIACLPVFFTGFTIARWEGWVFLGYYVAYTGYLVLRSQEHDALATYRLVMLAVVIPLTVLTISVATTRSWRAGRP